MNKAMNRIYLISCTILAFFIPYIILLLVFKELGFYPFGTKSLLFMDMDGQYVQFFESLRQIATGESSIFFSWSKAMGSNYIGLFAYYLSSPLSFIILLFNSNNIQLALFYLTIIKLSLCGLTFYIFSAYVLKYKKFPSLIFSTSYALISYNIMYSSCLMWIDGVILLPIILLGAEKILRKEKPYVFIISLAVMLISNYYISYMVCIFCVLFVIYRYFTMDKDVSFAVFLKIAGKFLVYALLSFGMSSWITLPVLFDLMSGKIGYPNYTPDTLTNFLIKEFIQSLTPDTYTSMTNSGMPALYAGWIVYSFCLIYFFIGAIPWKKKIAAIMFFLFLLCSFYFTKLDIAWHIFRYPNWFPFRYAFVFSFFAIFIAVSAFVHLDGWFEDVTSETMKKRIIFHSHSLTRILKSVLKTVKRYVYVIPLSLLLVASIDLYGNVKALITGIDREFNYRDISEHEGFRNINLPLIEGIKKEDDSFYRIEKTYKHTLNDALGLGYKGVTHYSSTFNKNLMYFTKQLGFAQRWFWNSSFGSTPLTDSLFNIKYVMSKDEMPWSYNKLMASGDITIYETPNVLPVGFMVDGSVEDIDIEGYNYMQNQNSLLNHFCGNNEDYFIEIPNIIKNDGNNMEYRFIAEYNYPIYLSFPAHQNYGGSISVNGGNMASYFTGDDNRIFYVGQFQTGTEVTVSFNVSRDSVGLIGEYICYLDMDKLSRTLQELNKGGLYNINYRNSHIRAEVDASSDGMMFTSIPHDEGFTVKIDEVKTEYESINDTFMIFQVSKGHHNIEISYIPKGFIIGLTLSVGSLILLLLHVLYYSPLFTRFKLG